MPCLNCIPLKRILPTASFQFIACEKPSEIIEWRVRDIPTTKYRGPRDISWWKYPGRAIQYPGCPDAVQTRHRRRQVIKLRNS